MKIKLLIEGGDMKPGPSIAQQLGPIGINIGKVISDVNTATKEFKGMKVPVELDVNEKTKGFNVKAFSPPTSEILKKEFNLEKGSAKISETKVANASIEDIIKISKMKIPNMLEKDLKTAVKSVLGTAASIGMLVESKAPNKLIEEVNKGIFDKEINSELIETSKEKRQELDEFFKEIKNKEAKKAAEKAAAEAAKATQEGEKTEKAGEAEKKTEVAKPVEEKKEIAKKEKK